MLRDVKPPHPMDNRPKPAPPPLDLASRRYVALSDLQGFLKSQQEQCSIRDIADLSGVDYHTIYEIIRRGRNTSLKSALALVQTLIIE